ncbi:MAG: histidine kinase [Vicingaceae bacterium]
MLPRLFSFLIVVIILLSATGGNAQPTPHVKIFTESNGYQSSKYISDLYCDQEGYVWIVTISGISYYDGGEFHSINTETTSHANFLRLKQNRQGVIYVIDFRGNVHFVEGDTLRGYRFNKMLKEISSDGAFSDFRYDSQGRLHISYKKEGYALISDSGTVSYPLKKLSFSGDGELCIIQKGAPPFMAAVSSTNKKRSEGRNFYLLNEEFDKIDSLKLTKFNHSFPPSVTQSRNGTYYFSTGKGNIVKFTQSEVVKELKYPHPIIRLLSDKFDNLWVSTSGEGVFYYEDNNITNHFTRLLPNTRSAASCQDQEGGVWIYSEEEGLVYVPYPNYRYFNKDNGMIGQNHVLGMELLNDRILVGEQSNLISVLWKKAGQWQFDTVRAPVDEGGSIYDLYHDEWERSLYLSQRGAVFIHGRYGWDTLNMSQVPSYNAGSVIRFVERNRPEQPIIVLQNQQFVEVENGKIKSISDPLESRIYSASWHHDSLLLNTDNGIYLYDKGNLSYLGEQFELLKRRAYSITSFNGELWFSIRDAGVYVLNDDSLQAISVQGETLKKGAVVKATDSSLWIIARQGTFNFVRDSAEGLLCKSYARLPQIVAGEIKATKEAIYWGTWNQGLFQTPFEEIEKSPLQAVSLKLEDLRIDGQRNPLEDSSYQLDYDQTFIQLRYKAISFQNWEITYRHRLKGLNDEWVNSKERSLQYTTLPAGQYTFELQARKGEQFWSKPIRLHFTVLPPIWERWWFILLASVLTIMLVYGAVSYRLRIIRREKDLVIDRLKAEQRALRAQMNPHFVFNILSSVQYLVMKKDNNRAVHFLNLFAGLMRKVLDYSNTNLISLEEELKILNEYLELEQLRMENSFTFKIEKSEKLDVQHCLIPPFLIQPFIENAIHHGLKNKDGDKSVLLRFKEEGIYLFVEVEDNGIGREAAAIYKGNSKRKRKSHGVRIIKERLALHNKESEGSVRIEDLKDKNGIPTGTKSTIKIKMVKNEGINY